MIEEKEVPQYESGFPAMRYTPATAECGYEYKIVNSSTEEKELGPNWFKGPDLSVEINPAKSKPKKPKADEAVS